MENTNEPVTNSQPAPRRFGPVKHPEAAERAADAIWEAYGPQNMEEALAAMQGAFGPILERILNQELKLHLGYDKSAFGPKESTNRRNGYSCKTVHTKAGVETINIPRDREGTFNPIIVPKNARDVSGIEQQVCGMYARGMSQRDIATTIEEIYGRKLTAERISQITGLIHEDINEWQSRPLQKIYPFLFVDCIYASIRTEHRGQGVKQAVYVILGIDLEGKKDILGFWISKSESKTQWVNIFDSLKQRGVEDILFISMDGVSGLEDGVQGIFPNAVIQRCIVHLVRNSLKYVAHKDFKEFCQSIKSVYTAVDLEDAENKFEAFKKRWENEYPAAVRVFESKKEHIFKLFDFPTPIRQIMYTTNAIESVNSSLRKVTKQGSFENENALKKAFYLRFLELKKKWSKTVRNWPEVLNILKIMEQFSDRVGKYLN